MAKKISQKDAQASLVAMVQEETNLYNKEQFWITDKVAFNMREMIKEFRKMYYGIFDDPNDPITGEEKLYVPLTRMLIDAIRKNVDLDPKDIRFRSVNPKKTDITKMLRAFVRKWLSDTYFNHSLNQMIFQTTIDGTAVWKTYTDDKGNIVKKNVDILNIYIDPTAESIQETQRFTERLLMTKDEVLGMDWENTKGFKVQNELEVEDGNAAKRLGEYGDVYESWGEFPTYLIKAANGEDYSGEDMNTFTESQVVVSGFDTGAVMFHYAGENEFKDQFGNVIKPYEEAWYVKVPGRWYGVGIAETVMGLQNWINTTVNLRIKKNTLSQLGLLKVRRGSKVTAQMLKNLVSKGVIELGDPERDLTQLQIAESGAGSYQDEATAKQWAQDVTSVFDISLGDLPASTSATGAVIQDKQSRSAYALVVESMEHFLQRWMDRQVVPKLPAMMKKEDHYIFYSDFDDIKEVRDSVVASMAMESLKKSKSVPTKEELQTAINRAQQKIEDNGDIFFDKLEEMVASGLYAEVFVTNAEIDVAVTVRNLLELRNGLPPEAANEMTAEALDLLGIRVPQSLKAPIQPQQQLGGQADPENVQSDQQLVTAANTISNEQR